ncbi:hypothetical protein Barb6_02417 [Bacteroidales bacterium Barb6]|nr:hypothetical protein Barb6_02417 [Bacteroidales bacterium Barb6]
MDTKFAAVVPTLIEGTAVVYLASITTQLVKVTVLFASFVGLFGKIRFPLVCVLVPFTNVQDTKFMDWVTAPERTSVPTRAVPVPVPIKAHPSNKAICTLFALPAKTI